MLAGTGSKGLKATFLGYRDSAGTEFRGQFFASSFGFAVLFIIYP